MSTHMVREAGWEGSKRKFTTRCGKTIRSSGRDWPRGDVTVWEQDVTCRDCRTRAAPTTTNQRGST